MKFRDAIRDGQPHWLVRELPNFRRPQRKPRDEDTLAKEAAKINAVQKRGYIVQGEVRSLTHYFLVPKGERDIRMRGLPQNQPQLLDSLTHTENVGFGNLHLSTFPSP